MESKENQTGASNGKLLTFPLNAGRAIVEAGAVNACPVQGTDKFVKFCQKSGLSINRERLLRLEHLGLFAPIFRVRTPEKGTLPFYIPVHEGKNWFEKGWAWDTTGIPQAYEVPDHKDRTQEGYYSIFQINYLHMILRELTVQIRMDSYLDSDEQENIDWQKVGGNLIQFSKVTADRFRKDEHSRCVALLCQFVSNKYFSKIDANPRKMNINYRCYSDRWVRVHDSDETAQSWQPQDVKHLFHLTREKLLYAYEDLAISQGFCNPIAGWHQLEQFDNVSERLKLKGEALKAETLRAGANMLRLLHRDLYEDELPHPDEIAGGFINHIPKPSSKKDPLLYLNLVVNHYSFNPLPRFYVCLEGKSEVVAIEKIFKSYYEDDPWDYSIMLKDLMGVDEPSGGKKDGFRSILRAMDIARNHQAFSFVILDNEGNANNLKKEARKETLKQPGKRYEVTPEQILIWNIAFEFDNFSCSEIATAMNKQVENHAKPTDDDAKLVKNRAKFTEEEVRECKMGKPPGRLLQTLYENGTNHGLNKPELSKILIANMMLPNSAYKIKERPIVCFLEHVRQLAPYNQFPTTDELSKLNQSLITLAKNIN